VAHTPELQGYTASKLYMALKADISQESLTLAATWIIGEYSEVLLEGGIVDEDQPKPVCTTTINLVISIAQSISLFRQVTKTSLISSSQSSTRRMAITSRSSSCSPPSRRSPRGPLRPKASRTVSQSCLPSTLQALNWSCNSVRWSLRACSRWVTYEKVCWSACPHLS
jgi:AP-1 complex subunit gamma-1